MTCNVSSETLNPTIPIPYVTEVHHALQVLVSLWKASVPRLHCLRCVTCQDGVAELLEASSAQLSKSVIDSRPVIATVREESSDESTVISSQTSTLTRNQGRVRPHTLTTADCLRV